MGSQTDSQNQYKVSWTLDTENPELSQPLRETLREVVDPEIGLNIIELGLVRDVKIKGDHAEIEMILTTPFCPYGPAILEMTRKKAESYLEIPTTIEMGLEMWDFSMMEEDASPDWGLY